MSAMLLTDKSGVYIVWANEQLLYIGRSTKKRKRVLLFIVNVV